MSPLGSAAAKGLGGVRLLCTRDRAALTIAWVRRVEDGHLHVSLSEGLTRSGVHGRKSNSAPQKAFGPHGVSDPAI